MNLDTIKLTNFRSYSQLNLVLSSLNIIIGPNGIGKTNILESILLVSTTKSHRTNHDKDLIKWNEDFTRVEITLKNNQNKNILACVITRSPTLTKTYLLNNNLKRSSDVLGYLHTVFFSPEIMDLIYGAPSLRRRFLDIILCQIDKHYLHSLYQYNRVTRERNKLLFYIQQGQSQIEELTFWNDQLIKHGSTLIKSRQALITFLNDKLNNIYKSTSGNKDKAKVEYKHSVLPENFQSTINKELNKEIKYTSTLFGPHRDDLSFLLNDTPISINGSRGECRSFILALKLSEIEYYQETLNITPILLLDDVFSELDHDRRHRLTNLITKTQTIITTTDLQNIDPGISQKANIIDLKEKNG